MIILIPVFIERQMCFKSEEMFSVSSLNKFMWGPFHLEKSLFIKLYLSYFKTLKKFLLSLSSRRGGGGLSGHATKKKDFFVGNE